MVHKTGSLCDPVPKVNIKIARHTLLVVCASFQFVGNNSPKGKRQFIESAFNFHHVSSQNHFYPLSHTTNKIVPPTPAPPYALPSIVGEIQCEKGFLELFFSSPQIT